MIKPLLILTACMASSVLFAQQSATSENLVQLSVFNPIQLHQEDTSVRGVRLGLLYGKNHDLTGVDYGMVMNRLTGSMSGWQTGLLNDVEGNFSGWQNGLFNVTHGDFSGLQSGAVNLTHGHFFGVQSGFVNISGSLEGVQVGVYNQADDLTKGLQIGLLNFNGNEDPFRFLPIVNWHF